MRPRLAAISLCLAPAAFASGAIIVGENNGGRVIRCNGRDVEVDGNQNTITLSGNCAVVLVKGNHNRVAVESVAWLRLIGSDNQVSWARGVGGRPPSVVDVGARNSVAQSRGAGAGAATASSDTLDTSAMAVALAARGSGGTAPTRAQGDTAGGAEVVRTGESISIKDDLQNKTYVCAGGDVNVLGNHSTLTLRGACDMVNVQGANNTIKLETANTISVIGANNTVTYRTGDPMVSIVGTSSTAKKEK
jgi:hypothetical protein